MTSPAHCHLIRWSSCVGQSNPRRWRGLGGRNPGGEAGQVVNSKIVDLPSVARRPNLNYKGKWAGTLGRTESIKITSGVQMRTQLHVWRRFQKFQDELVNKSAALCRQIGPADRSPEPNQCSHHFIRDKQLVRGTEKVHTVCGTIVSKHGRRMFGIGQFASQISGSIKLHC